MSRAFCIPGVIFLFCALVLSFLVSISLPFLPALDIVRTHFGKSVNQQDSQAITELRLGIWSACYYSVNDERTCLKSSRSYSFEVSNQNKTQSALVDSSWTRGLPVHPFATAVTFIAFGLSFSTHFTVMLVASLFSFVAALLALIAFAIDIALFALVRHEMDKLEVGAHTVTAPGFWMTFVTFILLLLAGCTVCFGRRMSRSDSSVSTSGGFMSRFRRNKA